MSQATRMGESGCEPFGPGTEGTEARTAAPDSRLTTPCVPVQLRRTGCAWQLLTPRPLGRDTLCKLKRFGHQNTVAGRQTSGAEGWATLLELLFSKYPSSWW